MPVAGRKPKPEGQRRNRMKPAFDWVEVVDEPFSGGPQLPRAAAWPTSTRRWWRVVSRMPHCVLWSESDWQFALDTAMVAAAFHDGDMRQAVELRQREKLLGVTMDARRDLRIRYVPAREPEEVNGSVTALAEYREMLDG